MKLIKKDGRIEEFKEEKLFTSIKNAANDVGESALNHSDINLVVSDVVTKIKEIRQDNSNTSSFEIIGVIQQVLYTNGFINILKEYIRFK